MNKWTNALLIIIPSLLISGIIAYLIYKLYLYISITLLLNELLSNGTSYLIGI